MGLWHCSKNVSSSPSSSSCEGSTELEQECSTPLSSPSTSPTMAPATSRHASTNAVNRSLGDIHTPTWVGLIILNSSVRATVFHPLQLALARKRVVQESPSPSVFCLIAAAHRGGVSVLPGMKTPIDFGPGGIRGLYRGYGAAFISSLIGESLYLVILESIKENVVVHNVSLPKLFSFQGNKQDHEGDATEFDAHDATLYSGHRWASAVAAIGADAVTLLAVTPIAVVVGRQMTSGVGLAADNSYRSIPGTFRHLWQLHQPRAEARWASHSFAGSERVHSAMGSSFHTRGVAGENGTLPLSKCAAKNGINPQSRSREAIATRCGVVSKLAGNLSFHVARPFWKTVYGVRGLYQGTSAALLRIPSSGLWWGAYTVAKEKLYTFCAPILHKWKENGAVSGTHSSTSSLEWDQNWFLSPTDNPVLNASASAIASAITTIAVNPIAVVQIRLQSITKATASKSNSAKIVPAMQSPCVGRCKSYSPKPSLSGIARDILRKEGIRGFFKGTTTNTCISVLDGIVFATMYELTKLGSDYNFLSAN